MLRSTLDAGAGGAGGEGGGEGDTATGAESTATPNTVTAVAFSPCLSLLAASGDDGVTTLHSLTTGSLLATFRCGADVADADLVEEEKEEKDEGGSEWRRARGYMQSFNVKLAVRAVAFSGDSRTMVTGGEAETLDVWDVKEFGAGGRGGGEEEAEGNGEEAEAKKVAVPRNRISGHGGWITAITFLRPPFPPPPPPNPLKTEDLLATSDVRGRVALWSITQKVIADTVMEQKWSCLWVNRCHVSIVSSLDFSADGTRILTAGIDGKVAVWNVRERLHDGEGKARSGGETFEGREKAEAAARAGGKEGDGPVIQLGGHDGGVKMAAFSDAAESTAVVPFGESEEEESRKKTATLVMSCGTDQTILFYCVPHPVRRVSHLALHSRSLHAVAKRDTVRSVTFSSRNRYFTTFGAGCDVMVWRAESGKLVVSLAGHQRAVKAVDFVDGEGGFFLASGDEEGVIIVWNLTREEPETEDDGDASGGAGSSGQGGKGLRHPEPEELSSWRHHRVPIRSVKFCGSSDTVVSCDAAGKVIIVDRETRAVTVEFVGGSVSCSGWDFWRRGASGSEGDVFLVTAGLSRVMIWDCVSGKVESHQAVPGAAGYIEGYDTCTPDATAGSEAAGQGALMSVACCTDEGRAYYWAPRKMEVADEDDLPAAPQARPALRPGSRAGGIRRQGGEKGERQAEREEEEREEEEEERRREEELFGDLVDLTAMVPDIGHFKTGFRGISFGNSHEIVAWGIHHVLVWLPKNDGTGEYEFGDMFTAGESVYGVSSARGVEGGCVQVVLEDGWSFLYECSKT